MRPARHAGARLALPAGAVRSIASRREYDVQGRDHRRCPQQIMLRQERARMTPMRAACAPRCIPRGQTPPGSICGWLGVLHRDTSLEARTSGFGFLRRGRGVKTSQWVCEGPGFACELVASVRRSTTSTCAPAPRSRRHLEVINALSSRDGRSSAVSCHKPRHDAPYRSGNCSARSPTISSGNGQLPYLRAHGRIIALGALWLWQETTSSI